MATSNNKKPKTIFDLIKGKNVGTNIDIKTLTLEEALKQVDDYFNGDPEMKQNLIEGYNHRREIHEKQKR